MLPKVEACMDYVKFSNNGKALITSLEKAKESFTWYYRNYNRKINRILSG